MREEAAVVYGTADAAGARAAQYEAAVGRARYRPHASIRVEIALVFGLLAAAAAPRVNAGAVRMSDALEDDVQHVVYT